MGIIFMKIIKRVKSVLKKTFYKIIYLKKIQIGNNTIFYKNMSIIIEKNGYLFIGKNCFFNRNCSLNSMKKITIGNNCIFGENVCIYDHNHNYSQNDLPIKLQGYNMEEIIIGDNCWVGSNVTILKGVTIGSNVVIGAGTTITKDVPSDTIVYNKNELVMKVIKK